jgi:hypothetical protein
VVNDAAACQPSSSEIAPPWTANSFPVTSQSSRHRNATSGETCAFGGELAQTERWESRLQLALSALRGLAVTQQFEPRGRRRWDPWPDVRASLLEAVIDR